MYFIIFITVFLSHLLILLGLYINVRLSLKKQYPEVHSLLFGQGVLDQSTNSSLRFVRFVLTKTEWSKITDSKLISLLSIYRIFTISFYALGVLVFMGAVLYGISTGGFK